ncbi:MAG: hypothetical protein ACUVWR_00840 [Anaerolineae bacterium]
MARQAPVAQLRNCARQTGKSTVAAILGLHRALYYPAGLVLLVSPTGCYRKH